MLAGRKSSSLVPPQVPAGYRPAALLVSYRRLNWWFASVLPRVCRVKSPVHRLKCLRTELASVTGAPPAVFALRGATQSLVVPPHGHKTTRGVLTARRSPPPKAADGVRTHVSSQIGDADGTRTR